MPRPVKETKIDTRAAREKLAPSASPYWREIDPGLHLGYRKGKTKGVWVARWSVGGGDHQLRTFADADDRHQADGSAVLTYGQAAIEARRLVKEATAPAPPPEPAKAYTVADAMRDYNAWAEANTKSGKDERGDAEIVPALGSIAVNDLTAKRIIQWRDEVAARGRRLRVKAGAAEKFGPPPKTPDEIRRRRSSVNRTLTILKAALNRAWLNAEDTGVTSDEAWRKVQPFEAVETARVRFLQVDEAVRLLNVCRPDMAEFGDLCEGALHSGARYGELVRLRVADFHTDSDTLFVAESKTNRARHIHLSEDGAAFFARMCAGRPATDLVFRRANGTPWAKDDKARPMLEACKRAKIVPAIGFHILRHTWASLAIMNGMPLMVVAENMGHADTRMVEKHYGHLADSYKAKMVRDHAPTFGAPGQKVVQLRQQRRAAIDRGRVITLRRKDG